MIFTLLGFGDAGSIRTGMTRDESRTALGGGFDEFYKAADAAVPTDAYDDLGAHVYFDEQYQVIGVEFLKWSDLNWRGQRLAGEDALVVQQFLSGQGVALSFNKSGFNVDDLGLRMYAPDIRGEDAIVESVYVSFIRSK
jgi:hypothetical protein